MPSAYGSMVKRTSCLASNEMFQVRILVGLLEEWGRATRLVTGAGWKPVELSGLAGSTPAPSAQNNMVSVVYAVGTSACEAEGMGSTPIGHPLMPTWLD